MHARLCNAHMHAHMWKPDIDVLYLLYFPPCFVLFEYLIFVCMLYICLYIFSSVWGHKSGCICTSIHKHMAIILHQEFSSIMPHFIYWGKISLRMGNSPGLSSLASQLVLGLLVAFWVFELQGLPMPAWLSHRFWESELQSSCLFADKFFSDSSPQPAHHVYRGLIIKTLPLCYSFAANVMFAYIW